jgi:hypothetical protein
MPKAKAVFLRPSITNPNLWYPARPPKAEWNRIRSVVLDRDNHTCIGCGHRAVQHMNVHHLGKSEDNNPKNLITSCVACHAVLHMGRNLSLQVIEIWKAGISQVEIVQETRRFVKAGMTLDQIRKKFILKRGPHAPDSIEYANGLIAQMGDAPRASLEEPLCAIFVNLSRWQIE